MAGTVRSWRKERFMAINKNKLLVISLDALGAEDASFFETLPNFQRILSGGARCFNVSSVYPSLTYPAHTSIVTGCYPRKHGIVNNTRFQFRRESPDWFWQRKYIKTTTLYDQVLKEGGTVAAFLWPVTARSKITWNVPEIFANRPWDNQIFTSLRNGSPAFQAVLQQRFGHIRQGRRQPALDDFVTECVKYTLAVKRPDLTLVHLTDVDTPRHLHGVRAPQVREAILRHDRRLGGILDILEENGLMDQTNVVILGDHYQKDTSMAIQMNYWLWQKGWLTVRAGRLHQWQVYCKNCDGSAYVYIRKGSGYLKDAVREFLRELAADADSGIEQLIEGRDGAAMGADPHCSFMLEAKDGYYFQDGLNGPFLSVENMDGITGPEPMYATHGYLPGKPGYQTVFMAKGPDVKENTDILSMCLVDEGPTLARLLGVTLPEADGRVITAMLKEAAENILLECHEKPQE